VAGTASPGRRPAPHGLAGRLANRAPVRHDPSVLRGPLLWAYHRSGAGYPRLAIVMVLSISHLVAAGGTWLLDLYVDLSSGQFWRIFWVVQGLSLLEELVAYHVLSRMVRPADPWLEGQRDERTALAAWRALAGLPRDFFAFGRLVPAFCNIVPVAAYITIELGDGWWPGFPILLAGTAVVVLYGAFLRFFGLELLSRPVLEDVSCELDDAAELGRVSVPLKWRMLLALPIINIVSGVVVVGLASPDESGLDQLGLGVLVTLAVSFTLSLELSVLLLRSILGPLWDLRQGTRRVAEGDLTVRVPVLGTDETGALAGSFNQMVSGLAERERLREAFGAYVDPDLAERVLAEGTVLEGEEVEVTVLFIDIRSFTAFAETAGPREVVERLNEFFECVVPIVVRHGGHASKFFGDGLLAVFGAPDRMADHADRGVAAALAVVRGVTEHYGDELRIGIGVNSGRVVAGTVGGGGRVEFTVIGDPVNTAARVERLTRQTDDDVLVTDATRVLLRADHGGFVPRGEVELRGKSEAVRVHAPRAAAAQRQPAPLRAVEL
jgi:adenylate cyclase